MNNETKSEKYIPIEDDELYKFMLNVWEQSESLRTLAIGLREDFIEKNYISKAEIEEFINEQISRLKNLQDDYERDQNIMYGDEIKEDLTRISMQKGFIEELKDKLLMNTHKGLGNFDTGSSEYYDRSV